MNFISIKTRNGMVTIQNQFKMLCLGLSLILILQACSEDNNTDLVNPPNNINKSELLDLINTYRSTGCNCGGTFYPSVPQLTWNADLAKSAYNHSKEMDDYNYFSHNGRNGSSPGQRVTAAGYQWSAVAENIAEGYSSEQAVILAWIQSPSHCKNIMNENYQEMGIGLSGSYWTQDLAAPR